MSDDWRVRADLDEPAHAHRLLRGMHEHEVERETRSKAGARLTVSSSDRSVFVYAETREQAEAAERALGDVLAAHELRATVSITRWHPDSESWEAADVPLPTTPEDEAAEHQRLEAREAQESAQEGPQWEVRIDLGSHREALDVADRLEAEGLVPLRRWTHVFISCATQDDAEALATRLQGELPQAERVLAEGTASDAWQATHPFAVLGGIAN